MSLQAFTIIAKNYVPFARVLARSFRAHHPDARFFVFVIDEWRGYIDPRHEPFTLLGPEHVPIPALDAMRRRYGVLELATAVKPWVARHLIHEYDATATLYLDPDIKVYGSLTLLEQRAADHEIVLIPHFTQPLPADGRRPSEVDILIAGSFNLGFLGLGRGEHVDELLAWWGERLETECRVDVAAGLFVDQRWMDLAPAMHDVAIVRDPGYDVAYWNLHYRVLSRPDATYLVNGRPLRFFHFSGYDPHVPSRLSKHQNRIRLSQRPTLRMLCDEYGQDLLAAGYEEARQWGYGPVATPVKPAGRRRRDGAAADGGSPAPALQPPRRTLGTRIVDFENLIAGQRRSGGRPLTIARDVAVAVNPLRHVRLRPRAAPAPRRAGIPVDPASGVNVVGYLNAESGVGEVARQTVASLEASGLPVYPVSKSAPGTRNRIAHRSGSAEAAPYATSIICVNADMLPTARATLGERFFQGRYSIGFWNWEVLAFPEDYLPAFDLIDEVWVYSHHTANALRTRSMVPVTQVRLAVVPELPDPHFTRFGSDDDFQFLFMFDYLSVFERKNPLGLIYAFAEAFPRGSGASLVIKCSNPDHAPSEHHVLLADAARHPNIHVIDDHLDAHQKNALLARSDCYVSLHRAEGFGLTLAEAMYFGRPVIATGYSGNLEFMTPANSFLVGYELVPIGRGAGPYPSDGDWAEPDLDDAAAQMRYVFEHRDEAAQKGTRAAADIREHHSWQAAGAIMRERLEAVGTGRVRRDAAAPEITPRIPSPRHGTP